MHSKSQVLNFFLLLLFLPIRFCNSTETITIETPLKDGDVLISRGGDFSLGFFSPGRSSFRYLGIWFHKVREQTVVWVANRNSPINGTSGFLAINANGNLELHTNEDRKFVVWSTNLSGEVPGSSCCGTAQLQNSGNFVLFQRGSDRIVWQSFEHATDTGLPGMKLGQNRKTGKKWFLTAWKSTDDPGMGEYSYRINLNGSPQFFMYKGDKPYWRSLPWPWKFSSGGSNHSLFNYQEEVYAVYYTHDPAMMSRIVLDDKGYLRVLAWNDIVGTWKEYWSAPENLCQWYTWCGPYSKCEPLMGDFGCSCLPGYKPKYLLEKDRSSGCIKKRLDSLEMCNNGEGFVEVPQVKLPDTSEAAWVSMNMTLMDCEMKCLKNCSCSAYASVDFGKGEMGCLAWYGELIDILEYRPSTDRLFVRVDSKELAEIARRSAGYLRRKSVLVALVSSISSAWFVLIIIAYLWCKKRKKRVKNQQKKKLLDHDHRSDKRMFEASYSNLEVFSLEQMLAATNNFSPANELGQGGFGSVYKGQLRNGREVAIKRLSKDSCQGAEELKNEVMLIGKLQHRNLVQLLGYCIQGSEQILIYEYMSNKSLDLYLVDESKRSLLDWRKRVNIIIGIARGILYLHQDSILSIIHRDLKTSNILIDEGLNPKISDFGMARTFKADEAPDKTKKVVGTYGYMPPEYVLFGRFSTKSDVFSFGVILLEIISGKKNNAFSQEDPSLTLIEHVWGLWNEDRALEIIDSSIKDLPDPDDTMRCIQIGLLCVQEDPMQRPSMLEVLIMLNSEAMVPSPNHPAYILRGGRRNLNLIAEVEEPRSVNEMTISEVLIR